MKRIVLLYGLFSLIALSLIVLVLDGVAPFEIFDQGKRLAGLLAMVFLAGQFLLTARFFCIEQGIGQDTLIRYHRIFGVTGLILVLLHGSIDSLMRIQYFGAVRFVFPEDLPRFLGVIATLLLLIVAIPALARKWVTFSYDLWKTIHKVSYVMFPIVLIHGLVLGTTIRFQPLALVLWIICGVIYIATLIHRVRLWVYKRAHPYKVSEIVRETHDTLSVHFSGAPLDSLPGQFIFVQCKKNNDISPAHPFTLSSGPGVKALRISVKAVGDFTSSEIPSLAPGDQVLVEGPYGWFTHLRYPSKFDLRFVAGGIGITPFVSMLNFIADHDSERKVTLFWGNKTPEDIGFTQELTYWLESMPNLTIVHLFSQVPNLSQVSKADKPFQDGPSEELSLKIDPRVLHRYGYIDKDILNLANPNWSTTGLMVCGPPKMMDQVKRIAKILKIPSTQVLLEKFAL
jgi:predicted ferric reductase